MAVLTGEGLATFAKSKQGTPYVYGAKGADGKFTQNKLNVLASMYTNIFTSNYLKKIKDKALVGKICCDCSGLVSWYTGKVYGSSQLYSKAYARLPISDWKKFAIGTVLWKQGHVGVYIGDGLVMEERGIDYGCICSKITDIKWTYGLTFSWLEYDIQEKVDSSSITYKGNNPYPTPTRNLKKGCSGNDVKWLQWELAEAGFDIVIDGSFGSKTDDDLRDFQKSSKIVVDGICGAKTRKELIEDK